MFFFKYILYYKKSQEIIVKFIYDYKNTILLKLYKTILKNKSFKSKKS